MKPGRDSSCQEGQGGAALAADCSTAGQAWTRMLEMTTIFFGLPLLLVFVPDIPLWLVLWPAAGLAWFALRVDRSFDRAQLWLNQTIVLQNIGHGHVNLFADSARFARFGRLGRAWWSILLPMLVRLAVVALILYLFLLLVLPGSLFALPRQHPGLWLAVMLLYPLLSVYPQELIFRTFFLHRYQYICRQPWILLLTNALAFAMAHIIYRNWVAVLLTFFGGFLFARTYQKTRSTLIASMEHSLYGCLIFTIGLGRFFYLGGINSLPALFRF